MVQDRHSEIEAGTEYYWIETETDQYWFEAVIDYLETEIESVNLNQFVREVENVGRVVTMMTRQTAETGAVSQSELALIQESFETVVMYLSLMI